MLASRPGSVWLDLLMRKAFGQGYDRASYVGCMELKAHWQVEPFVEFRRRFVLKNPRKTGIKGRA